jgi:hypothetical protein
MKSVIDAAGGALPAGTNGAAADLMSRSSFTFTSFGC